MFKLLALCLWAFQLQAFTSQSKEVLDFEKNGLYTHFRHYRDTYYRLIDLSSRHSDWSSFSRIGNNGHGYYLSAFRIKHPDVKEDLPIIYVQSLLKGTDWETLSSATYLIEYILDNVKVNKKLANNLKKVELVVVPIVDREGHDFSWQNYSPRMTTRPVANEKGVNLDRNFPYKWKSAKESKSIKSQFPGKKPNSELEVQTVIDYLSQFKIGAVLDLQSFGEKIMYPYGFMKDGGKNLDELKKVGKKLAKISNYPITSRYEGESGPIYGTFLDYAYHKCQQKCLAYTVKLNSPMKEFIREDGVFRDHFSEKILPLGHMVTKLVLELMNSVVKRG